MAARDGSSLRPPTGDPAEARAMLGLSRDTGLPALSRNQSERG